MTYWTSWGWKTMNHQDFLDLCKIYALEVRDMNMSAPVDGILTVDVQFVVHQGSSPELAAAVQAPLPKEYRDKVLSHILRELPEPLIAVPIDAPTEVICSELHAIDGRVMQLYFLKKEK